jgi:tripartite-type tricarboxylate transporter receptor subunit TctC
MSMRKVAFIAAAIGAVSVSSPAPASKYLVRPITLIVPFAPGGPTDTLARRLSEHMSQTLGQRLLIENVVGAGGTVGVRRSIRAPADGYTILIGNWSTHVINGAIYKLDYDLVADLKPIALLPSAHQLIVGRNDLPAANVGELIAWLKLHKATVGTAGIGSASHASAMLFEQETGIPLSVVHYRGAGPAMIDLVGKHIDLLFDQSANSLPHVREGAIKAFAVTGPTRLVASPDIPTVDEAGLPKFHIAVWHGLWAPRDTPDLVVERLNAAVRAALNDPVLREQFAGLGQTIPEQITGNALLAQQQADIAKWWPIIRAANVAPQR